LRATKKASTSPASKPGTAVAVAAGAVRRRAAVQNQREPLTLAKSADLRRQENQNAPGCSGIEATGIHEVLEAIFFGAQVRAQWEVLKIYTSGMARWRIPP
jgi:hypothetical protein